MARIDSEMDALLTYAGQRSLCLWQYELKDKIYDLSAWEGVLWDPRELRQALIDHAEEPQSNSGYTSYSEAVDLAEFRNWRIVDPRDIYTKFEQAVRDAEAKLSAAKCAAQHFKAIWIDKSLKRKGVPLR